MDKIIGYVINIGNALDYVKEDNSKNPIIFSSKKEAEEYAKKNNLVEKYGQYDICNCIQQEK